jgi:hypothetical protein
MALIYGIAGALCKKQKSTEEDPLEKRCRKLETHAEPRYSYRVTRKESPVVGSL